MTDRFKIIKRAEVGRTDWDHFVDTCSEAWLWHRYDLQDAISTWPGKSDLSFAVIDRADKNQIVAVVPLHIIQRRIARLLNASVLDSLGGIACRDGISEKSKQKLLDAVWEYSYHLLEKYNSLEIRWALSPMTPVLRGERCPLVNPLLRLGCENTLTQTWVMDLREGKDCVWQRMEGRARTAIRKAEKSGVVIRYADRPGDLDIYYKLHCETYHRTGVNPHPRAYFEAIWQDFLGKDLSWVWFAELNGQVVAAENFGIYKKAAIYWTGAASSVGLESEANSLLQWTAIQRMIETGLEWYETGEAFPNALIGKSRGLSDFKKSFGGVLYPYFRGRIDARRKTHKILNLAKELIT